VLLILGNEGGLKQRVLDVATRIGSVVPGVLAVVAMLWLVDFDLDRYLNSASEETLLPLFSQAGHSTPYGALSADHLIEFASEMLLVFLPTIIVLPFVTRAFLRSRSSLFLLSAAIPAWITTFMGFTVIGAFRDWDALAFPSLVTTVWAGLALVRCCDAARIRQVCCVVVAVAGVNTALWVTVNADPERSTRRYEEALRLSNLSSRARAFGWETIGRYYTDNRQLGRASLSYAYAMEIDPNHPRYPSSRGVVLMQVGDYEGAVANFRHSIALDDGRFEARLNLGLALLQLEDTEGAVDAIRRAWELRPELARIPFALGVAYYAGKDYEQAIVAYESAIRLQPDHVTAHLNLGQLYGLVGDDRKKRDSFEKVLEMQIDHPQRDEIQEWLMWWKSRNRDVPLDTPRLRSGQAQRPMVAPTRDESESR
jgi:tetratricopeptide (TPR) repeat protein